MESNEKRVKNKELFQSGMIKFGERIAGIRKKSGITQDEVAESLGVAVSTVSRMERGENMPPRYMLQAVLQLYNLSPEESLSMLLDGGDYYEDDDFNKLRAAIRDEQYGTLNELLSRTNEKKLTANGMYRQIYLYAKVLTEPEIDVNIAIGRLTEALSITKKGFNLDDISKYRFHFDELAIVSEIGRRFSGVGDFDRAARIFKDAVESMDTYYLNERLKCEVYPGLLFNLSTCYGALNKHKETEQVCQYALKLIIKYGKFDALNTLPYLLNNIGAAKLKQGDKEGCLKITLKTYYAALAMEQKALAEHIKIDASKELGIDLGTIEVLLLESAGNIRPSDCRSSPHPRNR